MVIVKDPVCGMEVDSVTARFSMEYHGAIYYFCSQKCLDDFSSNPGKYLGGGNRGMHDHGSHGGGMGGCCGGGARMNYLHIILMLLFLVLLVVRGL